MDCVVGVDVGHSTGKQPTTGVAVLECGTLQVRTVEVVAGRSVGSCISASLRHDDRVAAAVIDGPLAPPCLLPKQRLCEQFLSRGIFASSGRLSRGLRLQPAPTKAGSPFLDAASALAAILMAPPFCVPAFSLRVPIRPSVIEIFPTLFMAALLPPERYDSDRSAHTDRLWASLMGCDDGEPLPVLRPYEGLRQSVESQSSRAAKHEARAVLAGVPV